MRDLPPFLFSAARFSLAGAALWLYARLRGQRPPPRGEWKRLALVSFFLLGIGNGALCWSEQWVPSGLASLIIMATPFWMILFARLGGETVERKAVGGLVLGFSGLLVLLWPDLRLNGANSHFMLAALVLCFSSGAWAYGSVYSRRHPSKTDPLMAAALQMLLASVYLGLFGLALGEAARWTWTAAGFWAMTYLAVFGSIVGYTAYLYSLAHLPTEQVAVYAYVNPLVAVLLGVTFLGERMDVFIVLGAPLVLWGIYLVNTARTAVISYTPFEREDAWLRKARKRN